jgi:hypothetical protein
MEKPAAKSPVPPAARVASSAGLGLRRLLRGAPKIRLDSRDTYTSKLVVEGTFRPGWVASLAAGCAAHGISILHGHAEADPLGGWTAEFILERSPTGALPAQLDFVALADRDLTEYSARIELSVASAVRVADHGGSLLVIVEGRDQIGFLATLLSRLARMSLFPVEMLVSTSGGRIHDKLWLRAVGHREPDGEALRFLSRALHEAPSAP